MNIQLEASADFLREYDGAFIDLQRQVQHAVGDLKRRFAALGAKASAEYDLFSSFLEPARAVGLSAVLEVDVGGGPRMLIGAKGDRLTMLALGDHDSEARWKSIKNKRSWLREKLATARPAAHFGDPVAGRFLSLEPSEGWAPYFPGEHNEAWWHFLDVPQYEALQYLATDIEDHLVSGEGLLTRLVLGGPGTGKTILLLKLLQQVLAEGFLATLTCSETVHEFLSRASRSQIPRTPHLGESPPVDVVLVDDPPSLARVNQLLRSFRQERPQVIVAAFDPLQLDELPTARQMRSFLANTDAKPTVLSACYRQRAKIAQRVVAMTDVLAKSTPFGRADKVETFEADYGEVLRNFNTLEFRYPQGEFRVFRAADQELTRYLQRMLTDASLWPHVTPVLLVFDSNAFPQPPRDVVSKLPRNKFTSVGSEEVEVVKGIDFQHAIILLSQETFDAIQGPFQKSGRQEYHRRRLLRIPVSRARDSLAIVVVEGARA